MARANFRFWLLQALGWLPYALLQFLINSDDRPSGSPEMIFAAAIQMLLAVSGSLLLRALYQRLQPVQWSELRWLGAVVGASIALAVLVDLLRHAGIGLVAGVWPALRSVHSAQPALAGAILLSVMYLLWSLLYLALSRQQRLERAAQSAQSLQLALKEAEVQRLLGQLSPHFTFNTINNIRALILKDPEAARHMLGKFAATLRYQFADAPQAAVIVADELQTVHDYLELARLQLGARLSYSEAIDPAALSLQVPKFSLLLLVENAIKHGLAPRPQAGILRIDIRTEGHSLQMDVRNSGQLAKPADGTGIGLENLARRLQLMYPGAASLNLAQDADSVLARVRIECAA